jgi:hypothetical protein
MSDKPVHISTSSDTSIQISQGYEVLKPKSGKAYPVLCDEWDFLREKINDISSTNDFYNDGGWALLGASLSFLGSILLNTYSSTDRIIAWSIVLFTFVTGCLCLFFAFQMKRIKKTQASEIVRQMEIIERRYKFEVEVEEIG